MGIRELIGKWERRFFIWRDNLDRVRGFWVLKEVSILDFRQDLNFFN